MKSKTKLLFWGLALLAAAAIYTMPRMLQSSIPSIYYITPNHKTYENIVNCGGTVQSAHVQSICLDAPAATDQVFVAVGDRVAQGDALLSVNQSGTRQLDLSTLELLQELSNDPLGVLQPSLTQSDIDWIGLASAYGLTATVNGGAELYANQLQGLLTDFGLAQNSTAQIFPVSISQGIVFAPMSGVVTEVAVQRGAPVASGKSLVTIQDDAEFIVLASVNESDIAKVCLGDTATVRGVGFSGAYTGEVVKIYPTARKTLSGSATETVVDVEIRLKNADQRLKSGFTAKVEIAGGEDYDLLTVPYEAIRQDDNNDEYVYVYEDGKIKKSLVTTGKELTNEVQILGGLTQESIVVYNPSDIKQEGMMIHLKGRADVD